MTSLEQLLLGLLITVLSVLGGKIWGERDKVSHSECTTVREGCSNSIKIVLDNIKDAQKEMKEDIREIKDHLYMASGK